VVASRDVYSPAEKSDDRPDNLNWDVQGANRRDERIAELFINETRQFLVRTVEVGAAGSFTIVLMTTTLWTFFPMTP
jgi:hypothetical protein